MTSGGKWREPSAPPAGTAGQILNHTTQCAHRSALSACLAPSAARQPRGTPHAGASAAPPAVVAAITIAAMPPQRNCLSEPFLPDDPAAVTGDRPEARDHLAGENRMRDPHTATTAAAT